MTLDVYGTLVAASIVLLLGPSRPAFLIVPLVGAFFIDITNALIIKTFMMLPFMK